MLYSRTAQHSPLQTSQEKQCSDYFVMNPHTDVSGLGLVVCRLLNFTLLLHCMLWLPVDIVPAIIWMLQVLSITSGTHGQKAL